MIAVWSAVFGRLVYQRHDRFASQTFDLAIFDQAAWLISRGGDLFISVRGLDLLGHHANLGLFLLAPFYWLGAGPHFLNLLQIASLALGAVPVFLLARDRLGNERLALVLAGVYLLHPAVGFFAWEQFHPEVMAITPLFFAWWFARRKRWGWFATSLVYAVSWKEDVALAAAVLGVVLLVSRRAPSEPRGRHRRIGLLTAGLAVVWFLFVNRVLLPGVSGEAFYDHLFSNLGDSPWEIATTMLVHPTRVIRSLGAPDARTYVWQMMAPFAFLPLLAPAALGLGAPQFVLNVVSEAGFTRSISYHFSALPLAAMTLGTAEAVGFLGRRADVRRLLVGAVAATSLAGAILWGVSPLGREYDEGWWPAANARQAAMHQAVGLPPADAAVSATYEFVPHMAHRRAIYDWPNPWVATNWGLHNEGTPDPRVVEWLVIDRRLTGPTSGLLEQLLHDGDFEVRFDRQDIVVARRVGSGPSSDGR
jgi:uncharacterized membrane protein